MMKCDIIWNSLSLDEWEKRFFLIPRSNFMQSYVYALGACRYYQQKCCWGLIVIDGKEAGLLQLFEAGFLWNAFHAVILDRGPLWFDGYGGAPQLQAFLIEFNRQFPKRWGRKRRLLLEVEDGAAAHALVRQVGLNREDAFTPYETYWLDLTQSGEHLRSHLDRKWRNHLKQAENADLTLEWDEEGAFYPWIRDLYASDKGKRGYGGISPHFLDILAPFMKDDKSMIIGKASVKGCAVAGVMFVRHGQSATYQIGVTTTEGRNLNAHHLLLWQGMFVLQQKGVKSFDLGGMNDEDADGVKRFKKGMGGQPYRLIGHYS